MPATRRRSARPTRSAADAALGRAIRSLRRDRALTLLQVATASGLSQPFLSQLELGRSRPSMRSLFRIAAALDTTQQALLGLAEPAVTVPLAVAAGGDGDGGGRLLLHQPGAADVTEFTDVAEKFS